MAYDKQKIFEQAKEMIGGSAKRITASFELK